MTYALLAGVFLVVAAVAAFAIGTRGARPRAGAVWVCLGALLLLTAVFDSVMIAAGFFTYSEEHLLEARIGLAPIEDFAYPIAGAILLPAVWVWLRAVRGNERVRPDAGDGDA